VEKKLVYKQNTHQVIRRKIPIRIKNVENPRGGGTVIDPEADLESEGPLSDFGSSSSFIEGILWNGIINGAGASRPRLPTAVTIKERIVVLNVQSNRKSVSHGFLAGIFGTLDRFGVVVDLISTSEVFVSMAMEDVLDRKLHTRLVRDLEKIGIVRFFLIPILPPVLRSGLGLSW
jgi:aspartate kinase